jgi:effector-binding domain-containing protein
MQDLRAVTPQLMSELFGFLRQTGVPPAGAPLIRYHVIDMDTVLDIEIGVPVAQPIAGNGRVSASELPAGQYASLIHTGPYDGLRAANAALIEWADGRGVRWDRWDDPQADAFRARYESYVTDPVEEPDPSKWVTEVAIKVAGEYRPA